MTDCPCPTCGEYDVHLEIHGTEQLRRIIRKIKAAVSDGKLLSEDNRSTGAIAGHAHFLDLDATQALPDVISYRFECGRCARVYLLRCETYHGSGGSWAADDV